MKIGLSRLAISMYRTYVDGEKTIIWFSNADTPLVRAIISALAHKPGVEKTYSVSGALLGISKTSEKTLIELMNEVMKHHQFKLAGSTPTLDLLITPPIPIPDNQVSGFRIGASLCHIRD